MSRDPREPDLHSLLQAELLARLEDFTLAPRTVLDVGAGGCRTAQLLRRRYPRARVLAVDLSTDRLAAMPRPLWPWGRGSVLRIGADAAALPLAAHSVQLGWSHLMLQCCDRPEAVWRELARVLEPGRPLLFSTLGPDTLHELRETWAGADDGEHVAGVPDIQQLGDALLRAGFADPVLDRQHYVRHYPDPEALLHELEALGAQSCSAAHTPHLTDPTRRHAMRQACERSRTAAGVPATWEVISGVAFAGVEPQGIRSRRTSESEYAFPVNALRRRESPGGSGDAR
jgi:malonyl-CoA O-methyltransferase